MGTVVQQTARPSSGQWTQLQRSLVPFSPPSWTFSLHDAPINLPVLWRTPPIPPTVFSSSYPQEESPLCQTTQQHFSPGCESPELKPWTPPLSETQYKPPTSWNTAPPPPNTPTLPHHRNILCNSKCATHRWVGLYKPPIVTHSPLFALDTFHTFTVCT